MKRLIETKKALVFRDSPTTSDEEGHLVDTKDIDNLFLDILEECYSEEPGLFPADIISVEDLRHFYHWFRTFKKSSTSRAVDMNVARCDTDIVNHGKTAEGARDSRPNRVMKQRYALLELLMVNVL